MIKTLSLKNQLQIFKHIIITLILSLMVCFVWCLTSIEKQKALEIQCYNEEIKKVGNDKSEMEMIVKKCFVV